VHAVRVFGEPAQRVDQFHLLNRIAAGFEKAWRTDKISKALCTRDRDIEAIAREKKCEVAGTFPLEVVIVLPAPGSLWKKASSNRVPERGTLLSHIDRVELFP